MKNVTQSQVQIGFREVRKYELQIFNRRKNKESALVYNNFSKDMPIGCIQFMKDRSLYEKI